MPWRLKRHTALKTKLTLSVRAALISSSTEISLRVWVCFPTFLAVSFTRAHAGMNRERERERERGEFNRPYLRIVRPCATRKKRVPSATARTMNVKEAGIPPVRSNLCTQQLAHEQSHKDKSGKATVEEQPSARQFIRLWELSSTSLFRPLQKKRRRKKVAPLCMPSGILIYIYIPSISGILNRLR